MEVRILGAHNTESASTRLVSLLVDSILALDAGSLASGLTLKEQRRLKAILLTHRHFDHIKDVATLGLNTLNAGTIDVYSTGITLEALSSYILNGKIWSNLTVKPSKEAPSLRFHSLQPLIAQDVQGYRVLPLSVNHGAPTVGYEVRTPGGKSFFYSGDTGPGLAGCWEHIAPELLIIEVTVANVLEALALENGHLTPRLLREELIGFRKIRGYLPSVVAIHIDPEQEEKIREELGQVARELGLEINLAHEGMKIDLG